MARPFFPRVNGHVTYWPASRRPKSATVTALNGAGSTSLSAQANAGATTISTVATASVGQWVTIMDADLSKIEQRRVTAVAGTGPFTLTVAALSYTHLSGATVRLEATSLNLRIGRAQTLPTIARRVNKTDVNVWSP